MRNLIGKEVIKSLQRKVSKHKKEKLALLNKFKKEGKKRFGWGLRNGLK